MFELYTIERKPLNGRELRDDKFYSRTTFMVLCCAHTHTHECSSSCMSMSYTAHRIGLEGAAHERATRTKAKIHILIDRRRRVWRSLIVL